jgi:predicted HicB family RNase H-like nuclease
MMEYKGYMGKVELDAEAGILHGQVIGIRDVVTFQGTSVGEVEKAFRESVDDYLAFCQQRGEEPNKPCSGKFVVRAGADLHRRLDILARTQGRSLNSVVNEFLEQGVRNLIPAGSSLPNKPIPVRRRLQGRRDSVKVTR